MIDKIVLNNKTLDDIDLSKYFNYLGSKYQPHFSEVSGKEHYRLLQLKIPVVTVFEALKMNL